MIPKCIHQRCDLVSLSVVCAIRANNVCPYAGTPEKIQCPKFRMGLQ